MNKIDLKMFLSKEDLDYLYNHLGEERINSILKLGTSIMKKLSPGETCGLIGLLLLAIGVLSKEYGEDNKEIKNFTEEIMYFSNKFINIFIQSILTQEAWAKSLNIPTDSKSFN